MTYPLWIQNYNRISNYQDTYPLALEIFKHPLSHWYADNPKKPHKYLENAIKRLLKRAEPSLPVFVIYNIPNRDIGQYSKGGAKTKDTYLDFIDRFAKGIGDKSPIIIYEPDALPHSTLLSEEEQEWRLDLMKEALEHLTENCNGLVYIDVGHSNWLQPKQASKLLTLISNDKIKGFSVNVCNYRNTDECIEWADQICKWRKNDTYIIDTSRNGNGPSEDEWCNPKGRGLGYAPTTITHSDKCDAYLWIKIPGESDGKCNGGPKAGKFWGEQAEELVKNRTT